MTHLHEVGTTENNYEGKTKEKIWNVEINKELKKEKGEKSEEFKKRKSIKDKYENCVMMKLTNGEKTERREQYESYHVETNKTKG